jgi:hypothetical protein
MPPIDHDPGDPKGSSVDSCLVDAVGRDLFEEGADEIVKSGVVACRQTALDNDTELGAIWLKQPEIGLRSPDVSGKNHRWSDQCLSDQCRLLDLPLNHSVA